MYKTSIIRREHFNAAHRLHNVNWSDAQNEMVFGKCNNPHYHGHNYELEVILTGMVNPDTGYVTDTKILSDIIKKYILDEFDHKNLNIEVEHFKNTIPTVENIARVIFEILTPHIDQNLELKIRLYETPRNYAEYPA